MGDRREGVDPMNREWKPGDVAVVKYSHTGPMVAVRVQDDDEGHWHTECDTTAAGMLAEYVRPLVVIDPEDDGQVDELREALAHAQSFGEFATALREFATPTPPKPDEPQGLGAVVEDAEGYRFVRNYDDESTHPWRVIDPAANHTFGWWKWDDIAAVRILGPGVTS
jgi:hypothetical protein